MSEDKEKDFENAQNPGDTEDTVTGAREAAAGIAEGKSAIEEAAEEARKQTEEDSAGTRQGASEAGSEAEGTEGESEAGSEAEGTEGESEAEEAEAEEESAEEGPEAGETRAAQDEAEGANGEDESESGKADNEQTESTAEGKKETAQRAYKKHSQTSPPSVKQPDSIKKKRGFNMTTLTVIIVTVVVVLACAAFALYKTGTFRKWFPSKAKMTLAPHDTIELSESVKDVDDDTIDTYVTNFQNYYKTTEEVYEGTVEDGDTVHIVYTGTIDGEEFDGGSTGEDGADLEIGSGSYIDGFEDGLIGAEVGEEVTLDLTFPDDYSTEEYAGKDVTFVVDIEYITVTVTPEMTDEFVSDNSELYTILMFGEGTQLDTVDEFRDYIYDYLFALQRDDALEDALYDLITVTSYDGKMYDLAYEYSEEELEYYAYYYGYDADELAGLYGYDGADDYCTSETEYELTIAMLYSALADEIGVTHTDEEVDESITEYMEENGYTDYYTLDEFKEANGDIWVYMYENYQMNYEPVIEAMRERIVYTADEESETEEESAEE